MEGVQFDINVITGGSNGAIESIVGGLGEITGQLNILNRNFIGFAQQSTSGLGQVNRQVQETESSFSKLGKAAFGLNNINQALTGITNDLNNAVEPGIKFNAALKDAQAISGATEAQIDKLGISARSTAKEFGIDAAQGIETYKIYLSKLGPELANNQTALEGFGRESAILSKQLKGDTVGATELITTALNQFGVSIKDPVAAMKTAGVMMNIMSAAAQEGSAELPQIKSALEESGMMAKTANVSFTELNASIQVLDKAGKKGAEGGVAIRNVLAELSQGKMMPRAQLEMLKAAHIDIEKLSDKSLSFSDRLKALNPIVNDNAAMVKLFGKENVAAGIALVQGTAEIDRMTGKIGGTTSAVTMAKVEMSSYEERINRIKARMHDFGISIFDATKPFLPFITMGMGGLQVLANLGMAANLFSMFSIPKMVAGIGTSIASMVTWIGTTVTATAAQWGLNIALSANPVGLIVIGIAALAAGLVIAYQKSETFRAAIAGLIDVGKILMDLYVGLGKTILGALTINPAMIIEGAKQAASSVAEIANGGIGKAFNKGFDDIIAESKKKAAIEGATKGAAGDITGKADVVIAGITTKGDVAKGGSLQNYDPHKKKGKEGSELASNITAGGRRPTTIHLTIQKVIGIGEMKTTNFVGSAKEAGKQVVEEVLMALQSVNGKVSME